MIKQDLEDLLSPLISKCGCELWGLEFSSIAGKGKVLRIFIDAIHGVDLSDCEKVSREIDDFFNLRIFSMIFKASRFLHLGLIENYLI